MSLARRRGLRVLRWGALLLVTVLLVLAARRLDLARVLDELARARPGWIVLALGCFACILPLWAWQWRLLVPHESRPRFSTMLGVIAMTSTVLNTTPLLVGEAAGVFFLVVEAGLSRVAAVSMLAMDQLFVGLAKLFVIAGAAATTPLPLRITRGAYALLAVVGILLAAIVVVAWRAEWLAGAAHRVLPARAVTLVASLDAALAPIRSPARSGGALALALAKKCAEALAILCVQRAFGVRLEPGSALLILATTNLATLLPVVPGNLGVYEGAVTLAYAWLGVPPERAVGIGIVQHACYFAALALPGYRWLARSAPARKTPAAA